jgi:hypothetical protein
MCFSMIIQARDIMIASRFESECAEQIAHMTEAEKDKALQQYRDEYFAKIDAEYAAELEALSPDERFNSMFIMSIS